MVWLGWIYTTWVTNWLDPQRIPVRLMLVVLMLVSLVMSAGLPDAFGNRGLWVGAAYAAMQVGRSVFAVAGLAGDRLQRNFQRILAWCLLSGAVGFYTPGLGRSSTTDWTISGSHIAERCQAFVLIALGESVVVIGGTLSGLPSVTAAQAGAFVAAFAGVVALWWVYFDRSAEAGAERVAGSADPGWLGRSAYHFIHPIMVGGIIVIAAADERVLTEPTDRTSASTAWLVLGGTALFLAGHAAFKVTVWQTVPWTRLAAIAGLAVLAIVATSLSALALGTITAAVVVLPAASDRLPSGKSRRSRRSGQDSAPASTGNRTGRP